MVLRIALLATLLALLVVALLYPYRAQTPAVEHISNSTALAEIQQGRVRAIVIDGNQATMTLADGTKQLVTVSDRGNEFVRAVLDRNQAEPTRPIELRCEQQGPALGLAFAVLVSLLPCSCSSRSSCSRHPRSNGRAQDGDTSSSRGSRTCAIAARSRRTSSSARRPASSAK